MLCGIDEDGRGTYTADGIKAIAESISVSPSLTSINLRENYLGPEGAKALAPAIRDSASLTWISLYDNPVGVEGEALLREAVEGRPGIYVFPHPSIADLI